MLVLLVIMIFIITLTDYVLQNMNSQDIVST